jgi:hypothetical protein
MLQKEEIIYQLYPDATWTSRDGDTYLVKDKDGKTISIDQNAVDTEFTKQDYKNKREPEYPSIEDQLDLIYHSGIDAWKTKIKETKDKYPKPS